MRKAKKLILLTSEFPFGTGETFLESELPFLAKEFDQITIVSNDMTSSAQREIPDNCSAVRFDLNLRRKEKVRALWGFVNREFKAEKKYIQNHLGLQITPGIRNTMLISLFRAKKVRDNVIKVNGSEDFSSTICYSYWCDDNALGLALLNQQFPEAKTVSRTHGWDLYFEATEFKYLPYRKLIASGLDELFPISQKGLDYIKDRWGIQDASIQIKRLGSSKGKPIDTGSSFKILSCSNLIPLKRVDLIASALSKITDSEMEWFHFGDGSEMSKLKAIVGSLPTNIKAHLMGRKSNTQILEWYAQNAPNLFLNVSTTEGIPVSIMEAMSFGTPVLATDVGGTKEIVNEKNGELLSVNINPTELAARIQSFSNLDEELEGAKRQAAFESWNSLYNAERNYSEFAKELVG